ncbi:basic blue protein-like isoform X1 [Syzygium oleosum]|uniref:basic blue protein-like isoform X1 n=1 Tax=Syzygium oleosum TaxID=219896 RepID=UPI0011D23107|nr:basic blue protein-like isoform X1 [Syzygium oleosum]
MEETKLCRYVSSCVILTILGLLVDGAVSEVYTVGDSDEWNSGVDYGVWSQKYNFSIGDVLVFKYIKGQHNVYEVTESTFRSCDPSTGVLAKYTSGNDQVTLTETKKYWFVCNVPGHCLGGMRFGVVAKVSNNTGTPALVPQLGPPPPPQISKNGAYALRGLSTWDYLILFGVSFRLCLVW